MILEAVKRTDENATGQHASATTAVKMDESVETDREKSESDENWQTVTNQRSNKVQKTHTHAPTTTMSFFDSRSRKIRKMMEFIRTSLSETMTHELNQQLRNMASRNRFQVDHRHMLEEEGRR